MTTVALLSVSGTAHAHGGAGASGSIGADYASKPGHVAVESAPGNDGKPGSVSHPDTGFDRELPDKAGKGLENRK